ncbi:MAG: discoidin domain-containing protein [Gemmatimonadota bacterium]
MIAGLLLASLIAGAEFDSLKPRSLDGFERLTDWSAHPADGVSLALHGDRGRTGRALRLDFDFHGGGGYAIARRTLDIPLPQNYAFSFWMRGKAPPNTLEFKLVDASGENVWWYTERDRSFDGVWQKVTVRRRQISFAWGPAGGGVLRQAAALELVITAGKGGGHGSVWFDDLVLTPLPELGPYDRTPVATANASLPHHAAAAAIDGDSTTSWRARSVGVPTSLTIDFLRPREFGGVTLLWEPGLAARDYDLLLSDDRREWHIVRRVRGGDGGRDDLYLPDSETRYLRLVLRAPLGPQGYGLREAVIRPLVVGGSRNAFFEAIAHESAPGVFPRYYSGERAYWTVVGVDGAAEEALINEDGAVETGKGAFSIEPFLYDGRLITWHDVVRRVSLEDGVLPIPTVEWTAGELSLRVTAFAIGPPQASSLIVRYRVANRGSTTRQPTLYLAARPFQVNPPWQFLNTTGGAATIDSLRWSGKALVVNGDRLVVPFTPPARVGASSFDGGEIAGHLLSGRLPLAAAARDPFGAASAALAWPLTLAAGDSAEVAIEIPLHPGSRPNLAPAALSLVGETMAELGGGWHEKLDRTEIILPEAGAHLARSIQSTIAWILINRDGPALQPGSRSYERSWIRDGSLTSTALLRFGHPEVVRDFITWFAHYQYPSGKIPCCVDARGADPVPEHDSHGEFIYLVMEYYRHTGDRPLLEAMWPHVRLAAAYIDSLRQTRRTAEYRSGDQQVFFGLLPPSISHEGYSAKPMHSYWDDFFALRGLKDAAAMAEILGHRDEATALAGMRDEFRRDLLASLARAMTQHHIDYLPGAADLGDFDATSTTIAVTPVGEESTLPRAALRATFEQYWRNTMQRLQPSAVWDAYTPYELRTVGTVLRLGRKDRALALMDMFLADQEPAEWNQWPEVVWHDRRAPKFIGDSPHTWVGSDFLRSAADLFAYEREEDSALVVGAGVSDRWLDTPGVTVRRLHTWWGALSYTMRREAGVVRVRISDGVRVPVGGLRVSSPAAAPMRRALVNAVAAEIDADGLVVVRAVPAEVVFEY